MTTIPDAGQLPTLLWSHLFDFFNTVLINETIIIGNQFHYLNNKRSLYHPEILTSAPHPNLISSCQCCFQMSSPAFYFISKPRL